MASMQQNNQAIESTIDAIIFFAFVIVDATRSHFAHRSGTGIFQVPRAVCIYKCQKMTKERVFVSRSFVAQYCRMLQSSM